MTLWCSHLAKYLTSCIDLIKRIKVEFQMYTYHSDRVNDMTRSQINIKPPWRIALIANLIDDFERHFEALVPRAKPDPVPVRLADGSILGE